MLQKHDSRTNQLFALPSLVNLPSLVSAGLSAGFCAGVILFASALSGCSNIIAASIPAKNLGESRTKPSESLDIDLSPAQVLKNLKSLPKSRLGAHHAEIITLFLLPGTDAELAVDAGGTIALWEGKEPSGNKILSAGEDVSCASFSNKTGALALATKDSLRILTPPLYQERYRWSEIKTRIVSCDFAPNGSSILVGGSDGMIYRWRFAESTKGQTQEDESKMTEKYIGHPTIVSHVMFHPFGRIFFSSDWDGGVYAWLRYDADPFEGEYDRNVFDASMFTEGASRIRLGRNDNETIEVLKLSSDGQLLLVGTQKGQLELWKVRGLKRLASIQAHKGLIYDAALKGSSSILSTGRDGMLRKWNIEQEVDPAGGPDIWSFKLAGEAPNRNIRKVYARANGSCLGTTEQGTVVLITEVNL